MSFSESEMIIQLKFKDAVFVSAGLNKDILRAFVLDPHL